MSENKPNNEQIEEPKANDPTNEPEPKGEEPNVGEKKYSDADVDAIIEKKMARWKEKQEKAIADAKAEAEKLAKMNADQKKEYEMEKLKEENEKLKAEAMRIELGKTATALLKEQEIDATPDMLEFVVGNDADTTKANIEKFVEIIQSQVKAAEIRRATGTTPKDYGSNSGGKMTREEIEKIADPIKRQQAIAGNIELFR